MKERGLKYGREEFAVRASESRQVQRGLAVGKNLEWE